MWGPKFPEITDRTLLTFSIDHSFCLPYQEMMSVSNVDAKSHSKVENNALIEVFFPLFLQNMLSLLLPHHNSLRAQINEVLDLDLIKQQASHYILDISRLAQFVVGILSKLCAPARDEQAKKILQNEDLVDLFK